MGSPNGFSFSRRLADFLESLTEKDVSDIARGSASIEVVRRRDPEKDKRRRKATVPSKAQLHQVLEDLHAATDRKSGFEKLENEVPTKAALEALARMADLPVRRRDTVDVLRQKIVEATIGYRLRSQAVQGKDSDGTSGTNAV